MAEISENQKQTEGIFGYKWKRRDTYESEAVQKEWQRWLFEKYFDNDRTKLNDLLPASGEPKTILDAGCGSGGSALLLFGDHLKRHHYTGVDISEAADLGRERFRERGISAEFVRSDLNTIPDRYGPFDIIFSEGVLHHTDSVENALVALAKRLKPGGKFLFYVYVKKAPIREFTDDVIRKAIAPLDNDQAWAALEPLSKLGRTLGELNIKITVDDPIPYLGIEKGTYDLQRLFYYKICKAFYRPEYSLDEMNHINFDWFRPANCYRHTPEDIKAFCSRAGLQIERMHVEEAGVTTIATRPA